MKIRIKGNAIRYRLSKNDVSIFRKSGYIEEITDFGDQIFTYALQKGEQTDLKASFVNNTMTLFIPSAMIIEWERPDRIGFEGYDGKLLILIEKDFQCLDNVAEDQSDNYPNPNGC
ncbi:DUF7009 family protein [Mucilaginibacter antarcticus]|uniref:DUF7009 family protein n=1 Tax=Mucilaginibacter antarcticus TaxID=1855725 RepID=A0ABW5XQT0_9SPHI